jgi:hypothetical protein
MLIFALALTAAEPMPLTEVHQRDIGCVAVLGLIAYDQGRSAPNAKDYPDMRETGQRWAGLVGTRIMEEIGQPREVVAFALTEAVKAEQGYAIKAADPAAYVRSRFATCRPIMETQLGVADAANAPLPKPVKAQ